jgi:hypothetical protein
LKLAALGIAIYFHFLYFIEVWLDTLLSKVLPHPNPTKWLQHRVYSFLIFHLSCVTKSSDIYLAQD